MLNRYTQYITTHHWLIILLSLVVLMVPISGLKYIEFSTDYRKFFGGDDIHIKAFDDMQAIYSKNDNVMLVLEPRGGSVFAREVLAIFEEATALAWKVPYATRVDSITNFQNSFSRDDELVVEKLVKGASTLSDKQLDNIQNIATTEPATLNRLVSLTGHVAGININIKLPEHNINTEMPKVAAAVRELADHIKASAAIKEVYLSGTVMINNAFFEVAQDDLVTLMPIMFLLIIVVLSLLTRSVSSTMAIFMIVGFANAFALGAGGWLGIELTPPSAAAAPIIMTLSIAACVHLLTTYLRAFHTEGFQKQTRAEAMSYSIKSNFMPITLTSITTIIGFLTMNFADSPPFHDLGNLVAMGIVAAYFLTILFLPALMMVLPIRHRQTAQFGQRSLHLFAEFVVRKSTMLLWLMSGIVVLLIMGIPKNELNDEFVKYFDTTVKFRTDNDFITQNLTGIYQLEYSINADEIDGINKPGYLNTLEAFANWYRQQEHVWHVQSITDVYKKANMNLNFGDRDYYRTPENREMAAQALLVYEMSLPIGLDLNDQINVEKSATKFVVSVYTISANELIALEANADKWLRENAPQYMHAMATGPAVLFAHIGAGSIRTGMLGGVAALLLISAILIIAFRSLKIGIVSLVPNLIPAAMGFGLWGMVYGQINMALATVISMTLGIVVDDTIHFISKYLKAKREENLDAKDAIRYAFSHAGLAITVTSIVLIVGFMVLTFSPFMLNWGMGLLSAITIAFALLADFLLLPAILIKLEESDYVEVIPARVSA